MDRLKMIVLAVLCLPSLASGQVRVLSDAEMQDSGLRAKVVTNGDLGSHKDFELLVIGDNGGLLQMVARPQTLELRTWVDRCEVIPMSDRDPRCVEHHQDLLRKHPEFPILALKEKGGAVWWSAGGSQIPQGEVAIAQTLNAYAQATEAARRRAPPQQPVQTKNLSLNQNYVDPGSYYLPRTGPQPFRPDNNSRRPLINPQVDVNVPQTLPQLDVEGSVDQDTRRALYAIGGFFLLGMMVLGFAIVFGSSILANAVTDDEHDKTLLQQFQSVAPNAAQFFQR
jgi:hypothetical protein